MKTVKHSYISLINEFWRFYDENKTSLNTSDITLYFVLLRYCNKLNWLNPFSVNPYLMNEINPLSVNTYYKSLKNLNELKLIKWTKGKHNVSNQSITILNINNSTTISVNNSIDNSIKYSVVNNNKTIKLKDNKTIKHPDWFSEKLITIYNEFKSFRKEKKASITKTQEPRFISKLSKLSKNNADTAEKILIQSIENGWQGIFELKTKNNNKKQIEQSDFSTPDTGWKK